MSVPSVLLGVNIDHAASLRNARYRDDPAAVGAEPDPVFAAHEAVLGGADIITVHLREDRRHIVDRDVELLARLGSVRLNLEMAATAEMVALACGLARRGLRGPHMATLVPEGRNEVTTEGGLDVAGSRDRLRDATAALREAGITASAFIDPDAGQIEASAAAGFGVCEVHTGPYARAFAASGGEALDPRLTRALETLADGGRRIRAAEMRFNAGHALNYQNVRPVAGLAGIAELHIGHAIIARALFVGLRAAVGQMKAAIARGTTGTA